MPHNGARELTYLTITCLVPVTVRDEEIRASLEEVGAREVRLAHDQRR